MASGVVFLRELTVKLRKLGVSPEAEKKLCEWIRKRWGHQVLRLPCWIDLRRRKRP